MIELTGYRTEIYFGCQILHQKFCHPSMSDVIKQILDSHTQWEHNPIQKIQVTPVYTEVKKDQIITEQGIKINFKQNGVVQIGPI